MTESFDRAYWQRHHESHGSASHLRVNGQVVTVAERLPPGTALDVGCGDGAVAPRGLLVVADHAHAPGGGASRAREHPLTDTVRSALAAPGWDVDGGREPSRHRHEADGHEPAQPTEDHVVLAVRVSSPAAPGR